MAITVYSQNMPVLVFRCNRCSNPDLTEDELTKLPGGDQLCPKCLKIHIQKTIRAMGLE